MTKAKTFKLLALVLTVAMLISCLPVSGLFASAVTYGDTVLEDVDFDQSNIVLRLGAISDLHLTYDNYNVNTVSAKIQQYANAVAMLDKAAGHQLDAVLSCGDYTSIGAKPMGNTFAVASKAIFDAINVGKSEDEKTRFIWCYGNHDTCWNGNMAISSASADYATCSQWNDTTWEDLMNSYGLLEGQGAHIDPEVAGEGDYWFELNTASGPFYVISLECSTYNPNMYTRKTIDWLDAKLAEFTATAPDHYVYIINHAPIKNSGVYGANIELEKNANWAARDGVINSDGSTEMDALDAVLKKYSQVVYLSGHTHYNSNLESTIMSKNYTAINVNSLGTDIWASVCEYLEGTNYSNNESHCLLIEVDADGNQRIRRIMRTLSSASMTVSCTGSMIPNPNPDAATRAQYPQIAAITSVTATLNEGGSVTWYDHGPDWLMPTPDPVGKTHLLYMSDLRGSTPSFADGAAAVASDATYSNDSGLRLKVTFPAATANSKILHYRITVVENGKDLVTRWASGNWNDLTQGVVEGTNHYNATKFSYVISGITKATGKDVSVRIVAVDEFGYISAPITSDPVTPYVSIAEPSMTENSTNFFNTLGNRYYVAGNNSGKVTVGTNGDVRFALGDVTGGDFTKVHFYLSDIKNYSVCNTWAPSPNAQNFTPFELNDVVAYEADFKCDASNSGWVAFCTRLGSSWGDWHDNYTGITVGMNGVYQYVPNNAVKTSNTKDFKLKADGSTHHIAIVSDATAMWVWIDGVKIFDGIDISVTKNGTTENAPMYPAMIIRENCADITVSNQKMYYYSIPSLGNKKNFFDGLTTNETYGTGTPAPTFSLDENNNLVTTFTNVGTGDAFGRYFLDPARLSLASSKATVSPWGITPYASFHNSFDVEDTFVFEGDFAVTSGSYINIGFRIPTYTQTWEDNRAGLRIEAGGVNLYGHNKVKLTPTTNTTFKLKADGSTHHFIILSEPEKVSVWIDGIRIYDRVDFKIDGYEMTPDVYTYANKTNAVFSNLKAYYADEWAVPVKNPDNTLKNYMDGASVTINAPSGNLTKSELVMGSNKGSFTVNTEATDYSMTNLSIVPSKNDLTASDTVTVEFDLKTNSLQTVSGGRGFGDIYLYLRRDGSKKQMQYLIRSNNQFGPYYSDATFTADRGTVLSGYKPLVAGVTHHMKVTTTATTINAWIDGIHCVKDLPMSNFDAFDAATNAPTFSVGLRGGSFTFSNYMIYAEGHTIDGISSVEDAPEGNLLDKYGDFYPAVAAKYCDFYTVGNDAFHVNMYCDWLRDHGNTGYYTGNTIYPFGNGNGGHPFEKGKSYVFSTTVQKSNNSTPPYSEGGNYTSRLAFVLGSYAGTEIWCFYQDGTLNYYDGVSVTNGRTVIGIGNYEYFNYTAVLTPFGYKIYINGYEVGGWDFPDPSLFTPSMAFRVNGSEAWARNIKVYENTDYSFYADAIDRLADKIAAKGEWARSTVEDYQSVVSASVATAAAYRAGNATNEQILAAYNNIVRVDDGLYVPNNFMVRDGVTPSVDANKAPIFTLTDTGFILDQSQAGLDSIGETNPDLDYSVYLNGLNIGANDEYVVEFDFKGANAIAGDTRVIFYAGKVNGVAVPFMIQASTLYIVNESGGWKNVASVGNTQNLAVGHFRYTVHGSTGMSIEMQTSAKTYTYDWNFADTFGAGYTYVPGPYLAFKKQTATVSNLYIGYDVEAKYNALKDTYDAILSAKDGSYSTEADVAAALATVQPVLTRGRFLNTPAEITAAYDTVTALKAGLTVTNSWILDGTLDVASSAQKCVFKKLGNSDFIIDGSKTNNLNGYYTSIYSAVNVTLKLGSTAIPNDRVFTVDYDVVISDPCDTEVRLGINIGNVTGSGIKAGDKWLFVQNNGLLCQQPGDTYPNVLSVPNIKLGGSFHVSYIVDPLNYIDFTLINKANDKSYHYRLNIADYLGGSYSLAPNPYLTFRSAKFEVTGLTVGYDLPTYADELSGKITANTVADASIYSDKTVKPYNEALAAANEVLGAYEYHTKDEIVTAADPLIAARAALKQGTPVEIGINGGYEGDTNRYVIADGETLVTGERIGTKFILDWKNKNTGDSVTVYHEGDQIEATFVETRMLHTFKQFKTNANGSVNMRLIAAADNLANYSQVGWQFAMNAPDFTEQRTRYSDTVYSGMMENGKAVTAQQIFARSDKTSGYTDYANFVFNYDIMNIPASKLSDGTVIYARPFVVMNDGTVVYGDAAAINLSDYAEVLK